MARPSKLSDSQWETIGKRLLAKEKPAALAREYGISKGLISQRFSKRIEIVKDVAKQIVETDNAISQLNVNERIEAFNLADELKAISKHGASAARYGMQTAHRLSYIANVQAEKINEAASLEENAETIKSVMAMTRGANDAASIGLSLLNANKDANKNVDVEANGIPELLQFISGNTAKIPVKE